MKIISHMKDDLSSFVRNPGKDFTRNRKCPFSLVLLCILTMESHSLNRELRRFFPKGPACPTRSAFIQQRIKLNDDAFPFLLRQFNREHPFKKTFRGFHLLACDGSDLNIPPLNNDQTTRVSSNTSGVYYHQMHLNAVYDILEERYTDILTQPRASIDEREAFITFLHRNPVPGKCIFIADRGYFSFNVLAHLLKSGQYFLLRINSDSVHSSFLKRFKLPDEKEFDIKLDFSVTRSRKKIYEEHPDRFICIRPDRRFDLIPKNDRNSLFHFSVRLLKIDLPNGPEYLITNLPDEEFPQDTIKELYSLRWGIETSFRFLKNNIALNCFHSIRRDLIIQEIYARVILYNFTMLVIHSVPMPRLERKYQYKVSVSDAIVTCRDLIMHKIKNEETEDLLLKYLTDVRPDRSYPRKKHSKRYIPLTNRC